jgi:parvulin-like peptidyl-prolyl isomerase
MRNGLRALIAVSAAATIVAIAAPSANAASLDNIVVAHRGATTKSLADGTLHS